MTVTLVLSDIHANIWALEAVLQHAARTGYNEIWFLGDLWGYGPAPDRVWRTLFVRGPSVPVHAVLGNHDWEICGVAAGGMRPEARAVAQTHQRFLRPEAKDFVGALPVMYSPRPGVYLAHGAVAENCDDSIRIYQRHPSIFSPQELAEKFFQARRDGCPHEKVQMGHEKMHPEAAVFAVGQTHVQVLWEWNPESEMWCKKDARHYAWDDLHVRPIFFNPGSVGFPRDGSGCPGYAMINWETRTLSFHRVAYDTAALKQAMQWEPYRDLIEDPQFFIEPHCEENA